MSLVFTSAVLCVESSWDDALGLGDLEMGDILAGWNDRVWDPAKTCTTDELAGSLIGLM
jgi:hypothetical protein